MVVSLVFRFPSRVIIHHLNGEKSPIKREGGDVCGAEAIALVSLAPLPQLSRAESPRPHVAFTSQKLSNAENFPVEVWRQTAWFELLPVAQRSQLAVRNRPLFLSGLTCLCGSPSISFKEPAVPRAQLCGPLGCGRVKPTRTKWGVRTQLWLGGLPLAYAAPGAPSPLKRTPLCPSDIQREIKGCRS